jgi:hypothetical protein
MPQHFYLDKENLDAELEKIDTNLFQMLDLAYLHEDMVNTIESLMADWCKENLSTYQKIEKEFEELSDDDKKYYSDFDEYLSDSGRWWIETFGQLNDQEKENFIQRYRLTIACCLHSNTYDEETIKETIEDSW